MQLKPPARRSKTQSPSRVIKVPHFKGRLAARPIYIYLPPGYDSNPGRRYPVLYMHDGQNVFEAFKQESYNGSTWQADRAADSLVAKGAIRTPIIVGVANGRERRMAEYLPPYMTFRPRPARDGGGKITGPVAGRADLTARYYIQEVATYVETHFRALPGRENRATCGSSLGGLFSTFMAWEFTEFARHHAALSPSYWITRNQEGGLEVLDRIEDADKPDIRLWLDSGTLDTPGRGDDGSKNTKNARDVLLKKGFHLGDEFHYFLDKGAVHSEAAWAGRFPGVLSFLFPAAGKPAGRP